MRKVIHQPIRESVDSICRDGTDMPIGRHTQEKPAHALEDLSLLGI